MRAKQQSVAAFTLIELLTVVAIIFILAGLTTAGLTRSITNAKISKLDSSIRGVSTLLYDYYAENSTFPPRYGYIHTDLRKERLDCNDDGDIDDTTPLVDTTARMDSDCLNETFGAPAIPGVPVLPREHFVLTTYMNLLNEAGNNELYDPFATGVDTDNNGSIHYMEYSPVRDPDATDADELYEDGTLAAANNNIETNAMLFDAETRPLLYFPVNKRQAERVGADYVANNAVNPLPDDAGDGPSTVLQNEIAADDPDLLNGTPEPSEFPPPKYDAFVLMSVGPNQNTFGMVTELANRLDLTQYPPEYRYHILGTVMYYVLSRDADDDGFLDFHFIDRTRNGETDFLLLDTAQPGGVGPYIFVSE